MKQWLLLTAFAGLNLGVSFLLPAASSDTLPKEIQSANHSSPKANSTIPSSIHTSTESSLDDQSKWAAWMVESGQVAKDYVDGLDREQYLQSWGKGDQLFQNIFTNEEWAKLLSQSRKILGKIHSRKLKSQRPAMDPHGLPKGAYMVVEYDTSFEKAPVSGELLTLRLGADGKWRVLTYQVN